MEDLKLQVETLKTRNKVLQDALTTVCDDIERGEHVDIDHWVKGAINDAAHDYFVKVLGNKIDRLEKQLSKEKIKSGHKFVCSKCESKHDSMMGASMCCKEHP